MERSRKIAFGVASVVPMALSIFMVIFFFIYSPQIDHQFQGGRAESPSVLFQAIRTIVIPAVLVSVINLGVIAFFVVNVFRNPNVPKDKQVLWAILNGFVGAYAIPAYWYMYIWKDSVVDIDDVE